VKIRRWIWFLLLNIFVLAAIVGSGIVAFANAPAVQFGVIAAIVIAFANYSLVAVPRALDKSKTDEAHRRTRREYGSTSMIGVIWVYLIVAGGRFGLILVGVTCATGVVVGGAVWIGKKAAPPEA
jgi:uncharacterized membrane-anchored protein